MDEGKVNELGLYNAILMFSQTQMTTSSCQLAHLRVLWMRKKKIVMTISQCLKAHLLAKLLLKASLYIRII